MSIRQLFALTLIAMMNLPSVAQDTSQPHPQETQALRLSIAADKAIANEKFDEAIHSLKSAIKLAPEDVELQHKLAMTLLKADRLSEMWQVLRSAARRAPNHDKVSRAFLSYWMMFDRQGLFNTDETIDKVIQVLGKPDSVAAGPDRDRYVYGFVALEVKHGQRNVHQTIDLRGVTPKMLNPRDIVVMTMDDAGRKAGHRVVNRGTTMAEWILPGEKVQNWTQLVSIQRMHGLAAAGQSPKQVADGMLASLTKQHPKAKYRFITASDDSVLYEWKIPDSDTQPAQHEIARLIKGQVDMHRVAIVIKQPEMPEALHKQWVQILSDAKLQLTSSLKERSTTEPDAQEITDQQAWNLGRYLSVAVFAHARKQEETAKQNLVSAFRLARELNIDMPKPFELTDNTVENVSRAIDYLVVKTPPRLRQRMSEARVGTYELAARTFTLAMICSNADLVEKSMKMIRAASEKSDMPDGLIAALDEQTKVGASPDQIRGMIQKLHADAAIYLSRQTNSRAKQTNPTATKEKKVSQLLTMNGSKLGEITADGEVWIAGNKVGDITDEGEIWVAGVKEGEITEKGEIWKAGNKVGDFTSDGEIWRESEQIGSIESNGDIWVNGLNVGNAKGGDARHAAAVLFYGFYDLSE